MTKIAVDPGHGLGNVRVGRYDPGAVCTDNVSGITYAEADIALDYGLSLNWLLKQAGYSTWMSRTSSGQHTPVHQRARNALAVGCSHFVSLHLNAHIDQRANGVEVLYSRDEDAKKAKDISAAIAKVTGMKDRGPKKRTDLSVLTFKGSAVLVELGFITNDFDRSKLVSGREMRIKVCNAIIDNLGLPELSTKAI
jgi:N-acetylmuramoyl-L-alanine amidase